MDVGPRQYMLQDCVVGSDQNLYTITGNDVVVVVWQVEVCRNIT